MRTMRYSLVAGILALALMAIACGGDSPSPSAPTPTPTPLTLTVLANTVFVGSPVTLTASVPANWSVSPATGATIAPTVASATTTLTPSVAGAITVSATANGETKTATVTALAVPPHGELGVALAYGGRTTLRAPIAGSLTIVVPPEAGSYKIPEIALQDLREAFGIPISVSATASGSGENIFTSVPPNLAQLCGAGAVCLSGNQLYLARWGNLEDPLGVVHEILHRLLPGHCTKEQDGCSVMGSGWMDGLSSPKEKGVARWVQNGGK